MPSAARVDLNDLGSMVEWLLGQWWTYAIVGVIVVIVLVVLLLPTPKVKAHPGFPVDGREANELALGLLQVRSEPGALWNDPTASYFTVNDLKEVVSQWGVATREEWLAGIQRLVVGRRRRDHWQIYLTVRTDLTQRLGRAPKTREWLAGIIEVGGSGKRDDKAFVTAVHDIEARVRKAVGKSVLPLSVVGTSFDGYALGQAVALTTWGVALGHSDEAEARRIIREINATARAEFTSWAHFGLSYNLGRIMHWTDGSPDDKTYEHLAVPVREFKTASTAKLNGPWAALPWNL